MSKRYLRQLVEDGHGGRLGRPAHAHAVRPAPPRLYAAAILSTLCSARAWPRPTFHRGYRAAGALHPRRAQRHGARAAWPCCAPVKRGDRQLSRGQRRSISICPTTRNDPEPGTRKVCLLAGAATLTRRTSSMDPPPKFFRLKPGRRGAPDGRVHRQVQGASSRTPTAHVTEIHCTADLETGSGMPVRRPQGQGHDPLGDSCGRIVSARMCACSISCSPSRTPDAIPEGEDLSTTISTRNSVTRRCSGCVMEKALETRRSPASGSSSCGRDISCRDTKDTGVFNRIVELKDSKPF